VRFFQSCFIVEAAVLMMLSQQIQIMVLFIELAETYYYWAVNVPSRNDEYMKQALSYYENT
jgi:hypothetical protein